MDSRNDPFSNSKFIIPLNKFISTECINSVDTGISRNPIGKLQELCQCRGWILPVYEEQVKIGPDHHSQFSIACCLSNLNLKVTGVGFTKKSAKMDSAEKMLKLIEERSKKKLENSQPIDCRKETIEPEIEATPVETVSSTSGENYLNTKASEVKLNTIEKGTSSQEENTENHCQVLLVETSSQHMDFGGNPIGTLQELCQRRSWILPVYEEQTKIGPDHHSQFSIACCLSNLNLKVTGVGFTKKSAKMDSAEKMLKLIEERSKNKFEDSQSIDCRKETIKPEIEATSVEMVSSTSSESDLNTKASEDKLNTIEKETSKEENVDNNCQVLLEETSSQHMDFGGNSIGTLQELCTKKGWSLARYEFTGRNGPDHCLQFEFTCTLDNHQAKGSGNTKKIAKTNSATQMLQLIAEGKMDNRKSQTNNLENTGTKSTDDKSPATDKSISPTVETENRSKPKSTIVICDNPIGTLQELCTKRHWSLPYYRFPEQKCLDCFTQFTASCLVNETKVEGFGITKKSAKSNSALKMLQLIQQNDHRSQQKKISSNLN